MIPAPHPPARLVLLGHPVLHSLSPVFQGAALRAAGIDLRYELLDVPPDALPDALTRLGFERSAGNVTVPHKETVALACVVLTPTAERTAAVNTFWHDAEGRLVGDNTDVAGFETAVDSLGVRRARATVACIGAGGSAAGVCAAVATWPGAEIRVVARSEARARVLAMRLGPRVTVAADGPSGVAGATLVVNATPLGLAGDDRPIPVEWIPRDAAVMDLAYRPGLTPWVRDALDAGHAAIDGREMLLHQGAIAFARWTGREPDLEVMRRSLEAALSRW